MFDRIQTCSHCGGAIPTENFAREPLCGTDREVTLLYCDFCQIGIETLWEIAVRDRFEVFSLNYDSSDLIELGKFKQRLDDRRAA